MSLMFDTVAFQKGDIFIAIQLAELIKSLPVNSDKQAKISKNENDIINTGDTPASK